MGPGADPYMHANRVKYGVRHFDAEAHTHRQRRVQESLFLSSRRRGSILDGDTPPRDMNEGFWTNFAIVGGILSMVMVTGGMFLGIHRL